jgi:hypothetical protein
MSKTTTSTRTGKRPEPLRPMTEAEVMAAALADPDAMQLAALLLEKKAKELSEGEAESLVHPKRHASR